MTTLGFVKRGRQWDHPEYDLFVEFPGVMGNEPWFVANIVEVAGERVQVGSLESMILDRLLIFGSGSLADGLSEVALIQAAQGPNNWAFLTYWASQEAGKDELARVRAAAQAADIGLEDREGIESVLVGRQDPGGA